MIHHQFQLNLTNLSTMQRAVLSWLIEHGSGSPHEIATDLGFKDASVRRTLQELRIKGLVKNRSGTYEVKEGSQRNPHITRSDDPTKGRRDPACNEKRGSDEKRRVGKNPESIPTKQLEQRITPASTDATKSQQNVKVHSRKVKQFTLRASTELLHTWELEADKQGITTNEFIRDAVVFYLTYADAIKRQIVAPRTEYTDNIDRAISPLCGKLQTLMDRLEKLPDRTGPADSLAKDEVLALLVAGRQGGELTIQDTVSSLRDWLLGKKPALAPYLAPTQNGMSALQRALIELQVRGELALERDIIVWEVKEDEKS